MKVPLLCVALLVAAVGLQLSAQPVEWHPPHPKPATEDEVVANYRAFLFPAEKELEELRGLFRNAIGDPDKTAQLHRRIRLLQRAIQLAGQLNNDRYYPCRPGNPSLVRQTGSYQTSSMGYRLNIQVQSLSERIRVFTQDRYQGSEGMFHRLLTRWQLQKNFDREYERWMNFRMDEFSIQAGYQEASIRYGIKLDGELRDDWRPEYLRPLYYEERKSALPEGCPLSHPVYWEEVQRRRDLEEIRLRQGQGDDVLRDRSASGSGASDDSDISH